MSKMDDLEKKMIDNPQKSKTDNTLLSFFLGLIMLGAGIFMVCRNTYVSAGFYTWHIGGFGVPTGTVAIPLLVGIGMLFFNSKSIIGWIVTILGVVFLIITIIMSVHIRFATTNLYNYIIMFGCIFAGAGLLLKSLFKKQD